MEGEIDAMEIEEENIFINIEIDNNDGLPEFTLAEIIELENSYKEKHEESTSQEFCEQISAKFNSSIHRSEKSRIKWEQVQSWFQDRQTNFARKAGPSSERRVSLKTALLKKREKVPTISASEAATELQGLRFEARSAKDYAWFDVGTFLNYRMLSSGELVVRVRFAGFGKEEDEWVSVRRAVRERSIPLEPSECDKVNVGDLVLCFREAEHHALYCDAYIMEIERKLHDSNNCTCIFVVRYDFDNVEGRVTLEKICCRPTQLEAMASSDNKTLQWEVDLMQKVL